MLLSQFFVATAVYASNAVAATLPTPSGPHGVAFATLELINPKLLDPWAPSKSLRRMMVSGFYPTGNRKHCQPKTIPYMPPSTAAIYDKMYSSIGLPPGSFESIKLPVCDVNITAKRPNHPQYPVLLFSPGLGNSRLLYGAMAQSLASQGYVVITIDHPYDAAVVEFPDGSLTLAANISTVDQITRAVEVHRKDASFLLDQLHNTTVTHQLFAGLRGSLDLGNIKMLGHSLGGATAAAVVLQDDRVHAGINLDGTFFGPVLQKGLDLPFMIFAHQGKNESNDPSWAKVWPLLNSSKVQVAIDGTQHGSYVDFPILLKTLGLKSARLAELEGLIGTVEGERMLDILTTYIKAFFDFVGGKPAYAGLQGPTKDFPEVDVIHSSLVKHG
ncbi:hypothetical protein H2200_006526 [Cladophialophora chaetospira]|uniref:1-alkyl-2-acetylglycerophosphocholine esterase n=1 Tax=Cladophialophora chaetospira TaxID=386627 RepID=A0AA38X8I1_9EURO|nr:hypothetical protein H2200_006526 [Cladophialophora chaetospira]